MHASCISDEYRGAVAWCDSLTLTLTRPNPNPNPNPDPDPNRCDSDVTKSSYKFDSNPCNINAATWTEYCSPHSIMGDGGLTRSRSASTLSPSLSLYPLA